MIVKWPFHRFSPFQRFQSGLLASRIDTGSSSCDGGSEKHSFRERQPAESLQLDKKKGSARTRRVNVPTHNLPVMSTTSDVSSFGRRSSAFRQPRQILFTWNPMMAFKHTGTNCRVFGVSIRQTPAKMKRVVTHKTALTRTKLFVCFPRLKSGLAPSHVQVLHSRFSKFNSQKKEELSS